MKKRSRHQRPSTQKGRKGKRQLERLVSDARINDGATSDGGLAVIDDGGVLIHQCRPEIAAAMRYAVARLQSNDKGDLPARLAVTAPLSGEGVTFVARSLGAVMAHDLGRSVCVVDLNWWSPSWLPGPPGRPGVAEVLAGRCSWADAMVHTATAGLSILPAGTVDLSRRALVSMSHQLDQLLEELDGLYDHLVLDLPAVLVTSDALALAARSEYFVLVIKYGATIEGQVRQALDELRHLGQHGVILNRFSSSVPSRLRRLVESW